METFSKEEMFKQIAAWEDGAKVEEVLALRYAQSSRLLQETEALVRILALLVEHRYIMTGRIDALAESWMQEIRQHDRLPERLEQLLIEQQLQTSYQLLVAHTFPTIRETDNANAKRSATTELIQQTDQILHETEQVVELTERLRRIDASRWSELFEAGKALLLSSATLEQTATEFLNSLQERFYSRDAFREMTELKATAIQDLRRVVSLLPAEIKQVERSALEELDAMIGLEDIKLRVHQMYRFLKYQQKRTADGYRSSDQPSLHMIFMGNPGTGKTTLARLMAKIYHELGLLERPEVVETDRSSLVGAFVGQTEEQVMSKVREAVGGVLFIDEAYALKRAGQSGNDYGQAAIDTLVAAMTSGEYAGRFAVVLAGYPEEMRDFLKANPGLRSRFPESNHYLLADYTDAELLEIGRSIATANDYVLTEQAERALLARLERERVDASFGNGRAVRNIVLDAIFKKGASLGESASHEDFALLEQSDFELVASDDNTVEERLERLVGLHPLKAEIKQIQALLSMQKRRQEAGFKVLPVELHTVFSGNSGTGKTTVAALYADVLRQCGYLKRGHLKVVSRADLVSGYVGQTAQQTRDVIRDALGGVLFIDEAYALNGGANDFGKEAIDTLVDEMTKHADNLVVVLAGYEQPMQALLASNPGLKSRFKREFHFPNYEKGELIEIIVNYAADYGYRLTEDAKQALEQMIETVPNGNARAAITIVERAIAKQSVRLIDKLSLTGSEWSYLEKEDF
ncbi:AAA family ATPase [Exiguobacterium antarcticum]|uniref:AAA family ATPase n=1 Tax=Exiguobacterium antarcticum TaxID=132920 RepID=A0ABT6R064_9BACL|nr:AAA family ATPase [Exiguobacterium antarcticum]MDI3234322.1 AAA family ATPase [Exiguobacterium antarcticum]